MLKIGEPAPDFRLPDQKGHTIALSDFKGKSAVVLFFYPKDYTPGCTAQSCSFRDNNGAFLQLGAQIIGISSDAPDSHQRFAEEYRLPYPLLSDRDGKVRDLFGVKKTFGLFAGRATFVVDRDGIVRFALASQLQIQRQVDEALDAVKRIKAGG